MSSPPSFIKKQKKFVEREKVFFKKNPPETGLNFPLGKTQRGGPPPERGGPRGPPGGGGGLTTGDPGTPPRRGAPPTIFGPAQVAKGGPGFLPALAREQSFPQRGWGFGPELFGGRRSAGGRRASRTTPRPRAWCAPRSCARRARATSATCSPASA